MPETPGPAVPSSTLPRGFVAFEADLRVRPPRGVTAAALIGGPLGATVDLAGVGPPGRLTAGARGFADDLSTRGVGGGLSGRVMVPAARGGLVRLEAVGCVAGIGAGTGAGDEIGVCRGVDARAAERRAGGTGE